ncbi:MAG: GNAT family N-acetyltransferase [bacterium]|nr:GNAT family N-acetyltransferase [bacterium]
MNIRRATFNDARFLFGLRNEPEVRLASWNSELIEFAGHQKWLTSALTNPNRVLYVVENENKEAVGQVRYDLESEDKAEIGVSISGNVGGKGYGAGSLVESAKIFFDEFPKVKKISAHIKPDNAGSVKAFKKAGYSAPKETDYDGHRCLEMILIRQ